jgi:hypothetical protein
MTTRYAWIDDPVGVALGEYPGVRTVRKFGENNDISPGSVPEDMWNLGGIWAAPTVPRIHDIVSDNPADTLQVQVWGLQTWDSKEKTEIITLNGTTPVPTANSWAIIHRMRTLHGVNAGQVTATARTDLTITSVMLPDEGTTHMVIYGIGGEQKFVIVRSWFGINRDSGTSSWAEGTIRINYIPDEDVDAFGVLGHRSVREAGNSISEIVVDPPLLIEGPAIIKFEVRAVGATSMRTFGGFSGYLVDK